MSCPRSIFALAAWVVFPTLASAQPLPADTLLTRIIDTGPGHASVTAMPGGHYMVYDAGHWNHDNPVLQRINELVPAGEAIDLLVLSHSDSDHLAATDELFAGRTVRMVIRTGPPADDRNLGRCRFRRQQLSCQWDRGLQPGESHLLAGHRLRVRQCASNL